MITDTEDWKTGVDEYLKVLVPKIWACGDSAERIKLSQDVGHDLARAIIGTTLMGDDPVGGLMAMNDWNDRLALDALYRECQRIMEG